MINAEGRARGGQTVALEIAVAPLDGASGEIDRLLGLYQPLSPVAALMGQRIERLRRAGHRHRRRARLPAPQAGGRRWPPGRAAQLA